MNLRRNASRLRSMATCIALLVALAACDRERKPTPTETDPAALQTWQQIVTVLQHPRCLNCHQVDSPLQGDDGHPHIPPVVRGEDNMGTVAMRCTNCHSEQGNNPSSGVPGAPHWSLAPLSMNWAGLSSAELCQQLIDPERNGGRTPAELVKHMGEDKLVLWGWQPGGDREPVPLAHEQFMQVLKAWVAAGTPCPEQR